MSIATKLLLITVFFITLIQKILSDHNNLTHTSKAKTLVLIDDWHYIDTHSLFWDQLRGIYTLNLNNISNEF